MIFEKIGKAIIKVGTHPGVQSYAEMNRRISRFGSRVIWIRTLVVLGCMLGSWFVFKNVSPESLEVAPALTTTPEQLHQAYQGDERFFEFFGEMRIDEKVLVSGEVLEVAGTDVRLRCATCDKGYIAVRGVPKDQRGRLSTDRVTTFECWGGYGVSQPSSFTDKYSGIPGKLLIFVKQCTVERESERKETLF